MSKERVIVTGAAGFIGHHLVDYLLKHTEWDIVIIDKLSYSSKGMQRLIDINALNNPRVRLYTFDLITPLSEGITRDLQDVTYILHLAAETHVDNSIADPAHCIQNNVMSTTYLLEFARTLPNLKLFLYFSTDEVVGSALSPTTKTPEVHANKHFKIMYQEYDRHFPTNPYAASKSASEQVCNAYHNTYKLPLIITNVMNVYGIRQYIEKFIPLCIKKIQQDEPILIHSYPGCKHTGSRFYIEASKVADAIMFIVNHGEIGDRYNITGEKEVTNLEIAQKIATILNKPLKYELTDNHSKRPGFDTRYCLDGSKLLNMGWDLNPNFDANLEQVVKWTLEHPEWLEP